MPDQPTSPADLQSLWSSRAIWYADSHRLKDEVVDVWHGNLPDDFDDYFPPDMHVHLINQIRVSWDDLAVLAGKEFPLYVPAMRGSTTALQKAEKVEKVCYAYNDAGRVRGGPDMRLLMRILAWWLVGTADAVAMVLPDYQMRSPFFTFRDPRTYYPPVGWTPYSQAPLADTLFAYQLPIGEIVHRYPRAKEELGEARRMAYPYRTRTEDDDSTLWVGEYYHADAWYIATLEDKAVVLAASETGDPGHPGVMPVTPFSLYSPSDPKGRSLFTDQVSIQAALARMFSQKLDFFDRSLYPLLFTTKLAHQNLRVGPYAVNEFDENVQSPNVHVVGPTNAVDADQMISLAMGLSRMLNRNPESFQGQGEADSAKAIEKLQAGPTATVKDGFWPAFINGLPKLYAAAMQMDINLWGEERKQINGSMRNRPFYGVPYRPRADLRDFVGQVRIEPGMVSGGYQGRLELMQLYGAEMIDLDTVLEQGDWVRDADEAKRKIQVLGLDKVRRADLEAKAQQGMLRQGALAEMSKRIRNGEDYYDVLEEFEKEGKLLAPPPEAMGAPGAGGMPPELAALMGGMGGGPSALEGEMPPPLEMLRG